MGPSFTLGRVASFFDQGPVAVGVGRIQAILLGQNHCLDDCESFLGPIFQVEIRLFAIQTVKHITGCITQIEEWLARGGYQVTAPITDLELWSGCDAPGDQDRKPMEIKMKGGFVFMGSVP